MLEGCQLLTPLILLDLSAPDVLRQPLTELLMQIINRIRRLLQGKIGKNWLLIVATEGGILRPLRMKNHLRTLCPKAFFIYITRGHYVLKSLLVTMTRSCNLWSRGPEVRLGTENECYHIKYENILKKFR